MNAATLNRRLDRIDPPAGKYDHLSDEELENALEILIRSLLEDAGDGAAELGLTRFRASTDLDLPDTVEQFLANARTVANAAQSQAFHDFISKLEGQSQ